MASRLRYPELAPEGIASMRAVEHYLNAETALPAVLLELVRLRVSLRNGCAFCVGHHTSELRKHNEPESRIAAVVDGPVSDAFTPRERAALAWADAVTDIQTRHAGDADYARVADSFDGKDLVDLTLAVASINAWNRMSIAFRAEWDPQRRKEHTTNRGQETPVAASQMPTGDAGPTNSAPEPEPEEGATQHAVNDDGGKVAQS